MTPGARNRPSAGWRVGVDGVSVLVDDDVVVEPAQQHEPVWVVVAAVGLVDDVVGFEAVAGGAAVALAATIAEEHVVADALWEAVTVGGDCLQSVWVDEGGLGVTNAEDLARVLGPTLIPERVVAPASPLVRWHSVASMKM